MPAAVIIVEGDAKIRVAVSGLSRKDRKCVGALLFAEFVNRGKGKLNQYGAKTNNNLISIRLNQTMVTKSQNGMQ
jgi:hypothetical protein